MKFSRPFLISLFLLALLAWTMPVEAGSPDPATPGPDPGSTIQPGNYCVSCHMPGDERLLTVTDWKGEIDRAGISPCPAARNVKEELYYTERMLLAIERASAGLPASGNLSKTTARVAATAQTYNRLLDAPVTSLEAFSSEAQVLRYRLGKSYTQINQLVESVQRRNVMVAGILVTLVVLLSLAWGLRNASRGIQKVSLAPRFKLRLSHLAVILLVFAFFLSPIFRITSQPVQSASAEQQSRQAALDEAQRVADAADRSLARAWMLAKVGAAWNTLDLEQGQAALQSALEAAGQAQVSAGALWGEASSAQEANIGAITALEKAGLVKNQIDSERSRAWSLRLIAAEWAPHDPDRAAEILGQALKATQHTQGIYHDLDLRSIAVSWAQLDPMKGLELAGQVKDSALRAWGLREIAVITSRPSVFTLAAEAARLVEDPIQRAASLREIGVAAGEPCCRGRSMTCPSQTCPYFAEALADLEGAEVAGQRPAPASLAYALSDLAATSGDPSIVVQIDPAYPAARAVAWLRLGMFEEAWKETARIEDPYERARAQAAIAAGWGNASAASEIAVPILRQRALQDVIRKTGDASLVGQIDSPYDRILALVSLERFQEAWETATEAIQAGSLYDTYPLLKLALAWAKSDPKAALQVVEKMDREADKAAALHQISIGSADPAVFERAMGMALAARLRGDALVPSQASLDLALAFAARDQALAEKAFAQALEAARSISIK